MAKDMLDEIAEAAVNGICLLEENGWLPEEAPRFDAPVTLRPVGEDSLRLRIVQARHAGRTYHITVREHSK